MAGVTMPDDSPRTPGEQLAAIDYAINMLARMPRDLAPTAAIDVLENMRAEIGATWETDHAIGLSMINALTRGGPLLDNRPDVIGAATRAAIDRAGFDLVKREKNRDA